MDKQCAAGINLATLDWCMREWRDGYKILVAEFTAKDIAAIPIATDGKFRVRECKIVGEKNLEEIGLRSSRKRRTPNMSERILTVEQIEAQSHIRTEEVEKDIADTEREIKDMEDELAVLMRNPPQNKVRIYFLNGGISSRQHFVAKLSEILEYRKEKEAAL